jgi:hypothetical protein
LSKEELKMVTDVIERFLKDEISSQELYEDIIKFITSAHIRNGESEGNYFVIKKKDQDNFFVFAENIYPDNHREIPYSVSIYRNVLLATINENALEKGINIKSI